MGCIWTNANSPLSLDPWYFQKNACYQAKSSACIPCVIRVWHHIILGGCWKEDLLWKMERSPGVYKHTFWNHVFDWWYQEQAHIGNRFVYSVTLFCNMSIHYRWQSQTVHFLEELTRIWIYSSNKGCIGWTHQTCRATGNFHMGPMLSPNNGKGKPNRLGLERDCCWLATPVDQLGACSFGHEAWTCTVQLCCALL